MEILGATQYVDLKEAKEPWFQLEVISKWNFSAKPVCYEYVGKSLISFCLNKNTKISDVSYRPERIEELTGEMQEELIEMGYRLK